MTRAEARGLLDRLRAAPIVPLHGGVEHYRELGSAFVYPRAESYLYARTDTWCVCVATTRLDGHCASGRTLAEAEQALLEFVGHGEPLETPPAPAQGVLAL